jgi:single stranded DNA-binding protein (ssb)
MYSLNQVQVIGRLGREPEIRQAGASRVCSLSLAIESSFKDANGDWHKKTTWMRVSVWGKPADGLAHLEKGDLVFVAGELESKSWQDKDGQKRETTEIKARIVTAISTRRNAPSQEQSGSQDDIGF